MMEASLESREPTLEEMANIAVHKSLRKRPWSKLSENWWISI
jgi:hypothetical protein